MPEKNKTRNNNTERAIRKPDDRSGREPAGEKSSYSEKMSAKLGVRRKITRKRK